MHFLLEVFISFDFDFTKYFVQGRHYISFIFFTTNVVLSISHTLGDSLESYNVIARLEIFFSVIGATNIVDTISVQTFCKILCFIKDTILYPILQYILVSYLFVIPSFWYVTYYFVTLFCINKMNDYFFLLIKFV